ncbi:MAG: hypothetical protein EBV64_14345 [Oxalobacteraceae bacterium]|nr:hypothetical protein [Oxalobacteraceae bacterium]
MSKAKGANPQIAKGARRWTPACAGRMLLQRDTHFVESSRRNTALVLLDISEHQSYKVSVPL